MVQILLVIETNYDKHNQCSKLELHGCLLQVFYRCPAHICFAQLFDHICRHVGCSHILGLLRKLQCEKEPHQTKKKKLIVFWSGPKKANFRTFLTEYALKP